VQLKPGDGVVFDTGGDTNHEQGGRIFGIKGRRLFFKHRHIDFSRLKPGDRVWKTDDPALNAELRKTFAGHIEPRRRELLHLRVSGKAGGPLMVEAWRAGRDAPGGAGVPGSAPTAITVRSSIPLQPARTAPLTTERLREHLG